MIQIWYSIISWHRRKGYIIWLLLFWLLWIGIEFIIHSLALWESIYSNQFYWDFLEIWAILFSLYFWSQSIIQLIDQRLWYIMQAKRKSIHSILLGTISGLGTIAIWYLVIWYIWYILFLWPLTLPVLLWLWSTIVIVLLTLMLTILLSLLSHNTYLSFISSWILYLVSNSIDFIISNLQYTNTGWILYKIIDIIQYILPHYDLIKSSLSDSNIRNRLLIGHLLYWVVIYIITYVVFYFYYDNSSWKSSLHLIHN